MRLAKVHIHEMSWKIRYGFDRAMRFGKHHTSINEERFRRINTNIDLIDFQDYYLAAKHIDIPLSRLMGMCLGKWISQQTNEIREERTIKKNVNLTMTEDDVNFIKETAAIENTTVRSYMKDAIELYNEGVLSPSFFTASTKMRKLRSVKTKRLTITAHDLIKDLKETINKYPVSVSFIMTRILEEYIYEQLKARQH